MSTPADASYAIGFVGLGAVGQSMATHLLTAPGELYVYDIRPEAGEMLAGLGAIACTSPTEVANNASVVFVSLPSPEIVLECLSASDGLLLGTAMQTFVDLSTSGTEMAATVSAMLAERGINYLDAPVSGGPQGARNAKLTVMAAGASPLFAELEPLLSLIGSNVLHVGETPGDGQLTKVINNQLSATAMAATGEALALGVKGGLDPVRLLGAINLSSGRNTASEDKYPRCVVTRTFDYGFRLRLMAKDTALCLREAARLDFSMSIGSAVQGAWAEADARGEDTDDFTVIAKLFEERAGVTIEALEPS